MELAGGIILGITLMFSLLAFYPSGESALSVWLNRFFSAPPGTQQTAGVGSAEIKVEPTSRKQPFALSSSAFANGSTTPTRHTCDGANISPPLLISGVPEKTQSLVLIMDDPDAVGGSWVHWVVFNIPPTVREIPEGKEPPGRAGKNSWGEKGYGAPCPPKGKEHRYILHLYALSRTQALSVGSTKAQVLADMKGFVLAQTELIARYKRTK